MKHSEAYLNGWHAHGNGIETEANPYNENYQQYSHNQWLSGWCSRFDAIKHGKDLSLDDETGFTP